MHHPREPPKRLSASGFVDDLVRLTKKIHGIRPHLPVILMTGFRDSFNEQQATEAGVRDFILKPFSHRDLAKLLDRTLLRRMEGSN